MSALRARWLMTGNKACLAVWKKGTKKLLLLLRVFLKSIFTNPGPSCLLVTKNTEPHLASYKLIKEWFSFYQPLKTKNSKIDLYVNKRHTGRCLTTIKSKFHNHIYYFIQNSALIIFQNYVFVFRVEGNTRHFQRGL